MALLKQRWPNSSEKMQHAASLVAETQQMLDEYAEEDLQKCDLKKARLGESIHLQALSELSFARQKHVVRYWVEKNGYLLPDTKQLEQLANFFTAKKDAETQLSWSNCILHSFKNRLFLSVKLPDIQPDRVLTWQSNDELVLPDGAVLRAPTVWKNKTLTVRFRQGGERCHPLGRGHSQRLKKLLQEYALEPWLRDRVPLIFYENECIAVGDIFLNCTPLNNAIIKCAEENNQHKSDLYFHWYYS